MTPQQAGLVGAILFAALAIIGLITITESLFR